MRVFLSSTATDLVEHRRIADDTLLRLQQQSVAMERFGPLPGKPVDECERLAASCDLVVCIVAHRYGFEPDRGQGSITRREVEAARRTRTPIFAWIVDDKHPWAESKEQDRLTLPEVLADTAKALEVFAAVKALHEFKAWLRNEVVTDTFTTPDDLGRKIAVTLANFAASMASRTGRQLVPNAPVPELRIAHALQPAPHFSGREALVHQLSEWMDDTASPIRLHALVAAGGTGKTAITERVVAQLQQRWPPPGAGSVLVWSFYEIPDADAFLRECAQLFLGEADDAPAGGRLERLQRGLRDGRPHLIVLDGLERVQAEGGAGRIRGELEDHTLKQLLQAVAAGLGRTRALVTSRFPLTDLKDHQRRGVAETMLEDLALNTARQVLRGWGVVGRDAQLDAVCERVGRHALSVAVIGSYLSNFEDGRIEAAARLNLDVPTGEDNRAAKLARVLASYAERLLAEERDLLARLSVFPRGVTLELLEALVDAGGEVAGMLLNARPALARLLGRLRDLGLVFSYAAADGTLNWTAHPFVRERFVGLLGCPPEAVFDVVATRIGQGLEQRPEKKPEEAALLDRYEQLIEATRLAGRTQEAFNLYWDGLGNYRHLGGKLCEYARGYRILCGFLPEARAFKRFGEGLAERAKAFGLNELGLMARQLGRLQEAADILRERNARDRMLGEPREASIGLQNTCDGVLDLGHLDDAFAAAHEALEQAELAKDDFHRKVSLSYRAATQHHLGHIPEAFADFTAATQLEDEPMLNSVRGLQHARHYLDLGRIDACRAIADAGLPLARHREWNLEIPGWLAIFARLALAEGLDPSPHIDEIRVRTARTGQMRWILEAHDLAARWALARGDLHGAQAEIDDGLRQARLCGYGIRVIEMLISQSAVALAWPDASRALAAAGEALDLATAPDCRYAWGEADAAHARGSAFEALGDREHARRAFTRALAVRERIEHPQAEATRAGLKRVA